MVELRSGTNTGGQEPRTAEGRDPNIPEDIEVIDQGDQMANQGEQMMDPAKEHHHIDHHNLHSQHHQSDLYKRKLNQLSHMKKVMHQVQNLESHYQHLGGLLLLKHQ
jgi:hypothetical protein